MRAHSPVPRRLAALALFLMAACTPADGPRRSGDPALDADIRVSPTPAVVGESRVFVRATDGGVALSGAQATVRSLAVDTTGGGVPAPPGALPPAVEHVLAEVDGAAGDYGPVVLHFPAPGRWRLEVTLRVGGRTTTLSVPLAVVGGPGG
ncbi:MAG: hypothetical protein KJP18_03910 [Gemmatimonadetes bacterium]|nr:hypothetical protein [Gemmatimonadota bacterium]